MNSNPDLPIGIRAPAAGYAASEIPFGILISLRTQNPLPLEFGWEGTEDT